MTDPNVRTVLVGSSDRPAFATVGVITTKGTETFVARIEPPRGMTRGKFLEELKSHGFSLGGNYVPPAKILHEDRRGVVTVSVPANKIVNPYRGFVGIRD